METPQGWEMKEGKLVRSYVFVDFGQALAFINKVSIVAERLQHHPEIWNVYNKVKLTLSTHDAGNKVTDKDLTLAEAINML